jgi:putative SOS response-associated peptidase YedK
MLPRMCGRVGLSSDVSEIKLVFSIPPHWPTPNFPPSWNGVPTDQLPIVRFDAKAGERSLDVIRWGLAVLGQGRRSRAGCFVLLGLFRPALIPYSV